MILLSKGSHTERVREGLLDRILLHVGVGPYRGVALHARGDPTERVNELSLSESAFGTPRVHDVYVDAERRMRYAKVHLFKR